MKINIKIIILVIAFSVPIFSQNRSKTGYLGVFADFENDSLIKGSYESVKQLLNYAGKNAFTEIDRMNVNCRGSKFTVLYKWMG